MSTIAPAGWSDAQCGARVPHGIICCNSALAYWDLTDELPAAVHVAVARGTHPPQIDFPATAALHALNRYLRRADAEPRRLLDIARELGGQRRLADALEVVMS